MDNHVWKCCRKSIVSSYSEGKRPKHKDVAPNNVSSAAGAGGDKPNSQVSASRRVNEVDSNAEMIMD
jgi:hypothetical protein